MFGAGKPPQNEETSFIPRSPYACAKLYAYWMVKNYREGYGLFASNGILFNHESPLRGETFVTRKITRAASRIAMGLQKTLFMGNIDSMRDWGHAKDYVRAQWLILQQERPDDFVIASGTQHSVRYFCEKAFENAGMHIEWKGSGIDEQAVVSDICETGHEIHPALGDTVIRIDPRYFRPAEVETLLGDPSKAKTILGWEPMIGFDEMVKEMVRKDLEEAGRDLLCQTSGYHVQAHHE